MHTRGTSRRHTYAVPDTNRELTIARNGSLTRDHDVLRLARDDEGDVIDLSRIIIEGGVQLAQLIIAVSRVSR